MIILFFICRDEHLLTNTFHFLCRKLIVIRTEQWGTYYETRCLVVMHIYVQSFIKVSRVIRKLQFFVGLFHPYNIPGRGLVSSVGSGSTAHVAQWLVKWLSIGHRLCRWCTCILEQGTSPPMLTSAARSVKWTVWDGYYGLYSKWGSTIKMLLEIWSHND